MEKNNMKQFEQAMREQFEACKGHPQHEVWLDYALGTNERAQHVVNTLRQFLPSLNNKRHLDVGCGYGGTCIAFAGSGALSIGIDIDDRLLDLAHINKEDHPEGSIELLKRDIMDWEQISLLGEFDVITCDNVIEHVEIPERLILHFKRLLAGGGFIYLTIPNGFSLGQVRKDGHYGLFGISLLDAWDATLYVRHALSHESYGISFYYAFEQYRDLFSRYTFETKLLNPINAAPDDLLATREEIRRLQEESQALKDADNVPESIKQKLPWVLDMYFKKMQADFDFYDLMAAGAEKDAFAYRLMRDYGTELWYVILTHSGESTGSFHQEVSS